MPIAEASQSRLAYVVETVPGTTPATPTFKVMREVSESIVLRKTTINSDEIRADANLSSIIDVGRMVEGSVNAELSYGTFDDFLESLFRSTWASNVLKNGVTQKSFTLEKTFEQGTTDNFIRYRGCKVNTLELNLETRQIVRANFGIMGLGSPTPTQAIIAGATYSAPNSNPVLNANANIGSLVLGGVTSSPKIRSASLRFTSNLYANDILGQYEPDSHGIGRFEVSGELDTYFENIDVYSAIVGHSDVSLALTIGAASGSKYTISLPKLKLQEGSPQIGGNSQPVRLSVPFQAYYDSTLDATCSITRGVA